ncbi:MAG: type II toxin-antitoxin system VapC family toxin [Ignavibacteria bacterium]|nr:type II toxin-antitoxin system VapC family toxin [Ignavibacteria bacterium]
MSKVLIDTNIFIYDLDRASSFHKQAKQIVEDPRVELYTTSKNISEFFAVCSKLGIKSKLAFDYFDDIILNTTILFPDYKSLNIFKKLLKDNNAKGNKVYDIEIVSIMLNNNINQIATLNTKDFKTINEVEIYKV